jgi:hypothetical protein
MGHANNPAEPRSAARHSQNRTSCSANTLGKPPTVGLQVCGPEGLEPSTRGLTDGVGGRSWILTMTCRDDVR